MSEKLKVYGIRRDGWTDEVWSQVQERRRKGVKYFGGMAQYNRDRQELFVSYCSGVIEVSRFTNMDFSGDDNRTLAERRDAEVDRVHAVGEYMVDALESYVELSTKVNELQNRLDEIVKITGEAISIDSDSPLLALVYVNNVARGESK